MVRILLENTLGPTPQNWLLETPEKTISATSPHEVAGALAQLEQALAQGYTAAGFFSYELGYLMDPATAALLPQNRQVPLMWFAIARHTQQNINPPPANGSYTATAPTPELDEAAYTHKCKKVIGHIFNGDVYQANLTFKAGFTVSGNTYAYYRDLCENQPCAYSAFIETPEFSILSLSPELFFEKTGPRITVKPMKGTAPRGYYQAHDEALKNALHTDPKQRAENLMIVDLMRNDLGRVAEGGSITVETLFETETYKTLHQMTSRISATTHAPLGDMLAALFPCGSITGAPKMSAMNIIRSLEPSPRGAYCGAIGILHPNGDARFSVAIRTITVLGNRAEIGIGSGVVADSDPASEYRECLLKMKFLAPKEATNHDLLETMLWQPATGYALLQRHLNRLEKSARYLGYACNIERINTILEKTANAFNRHDNIPQEKMVRLALKHNGTCTVTEKTFTPAPPETPIRFVLSPARVNSASKALYHKTTDRDFYETEFAARTANNSCDEVVFLNERGELTEGSRTNIFIVQNGKMLTPALECGLLPGTLRAEMLETAACTEAVLTLKDLETAEKIYLGNSVRGLRPATRVG